ncbi:MAG TPA: metalloregulator ArsR/SmtB family transcription factor [Candidatus Limnocylindrales bacterium]
MNAKRQAAPTTTSARPPRVRDFSRRAGSVEVSWDVRTVYDFVFSLSEESGTTDDLPAPDRLWLRSSRSSLWAAIGEAPLALYGSEFCIVLAGLAVDRPEVQDAASFVALVREADRTTILRTILSQGDETPEQRAMLDRAVEGDLDAVRQRLEVLLATHEPEERERIGRLFDDPDAVIAAARDVLAAWLPYFAAVEPRVRGMLERDARGRERDARGLPPTELVERTTGGIRWLSEPGVSRVILAPSYFARPYNFLLGGTDWRLFAYPIADSALDVGDPLAPPPGVLRLHRALGDETRLRILRLLREQDLYLTEIATALELSKPTIKHHLAQLRAAGLVTVTEEGGLTYYSLRRERLDDVGPELTSYLR